MEQKVTDTLGDRKFDIGLIGRWNSTDCRTQMSYHALKQVLIKLGYSVCMLDGQEVEKKDVNHLCNTFLTGCDRVWDYEVAENFGMNLYLDFADSSKKRIAYASSLGREATHTPLEQVAAVTRALHKFDAVSVREKSGADVLRKEFGIEAIQVLDPIFLLERQDYRTLMGNNRQIPKEKYMLFDRIHSSDEDREIFQKISKEKNLKLKDIADENMSLQDWLYDIVYAECIVTDSCQGAGMAVIFDKPFVMAGNDKKQTAELEFLAELLGIEERLCPPLENVDACTKLLENPAGEKTKTILAMEKSRSMQWLKTALESPKVLDKTILSVLKKECCGCGACYNACPVDAITTYYDSEGAVYPKVDFEKCIGCGKCRRVCPGLHPESSNWKEPKCFAGYASDEIRKVSSSGGIFTVLAEHVLKEGGVVCGAAMDEHQVISHMVVEKTEDLNKLRSSKYIQSNTKKTFTEVKKALDAGRSALYTGCGCQIAGLKRFLAKDYEKLITIDLLCHGGPTQGSFDKYLEDVHRDKKITYAGFRDKDVFSWGINSTGMTVKYDDGTEYRMKKLRDPFYLAFTKAYIVRPHCQVCNYAALPRQGDITLGDFWGIEKYNKEYTDGKGTSIISVNSEKGMTALEQVREQFKLLEEVPLEDILQRGQPYQRPYRAVPLRDRFMRMLKDVSFRKCLECCQKDTFDYGYYALKANCIADVLDGFACYKMMSRNDASILMVWDRTEESISPLQHRTAEFSRRRFPEFMEIRDSESIAKLQTRCRDFAVSRGSIGSWGEKQLGNSGKKLNLSKTLSKWIHPALLLPAEFYTDIIEEDYAGETAVTSKESKQYLAFYVRGAENEKIKKIQKSIQNGMDLTEDYSIEQWLCYLKNAGGIVTDCREAVDMAIQFRVPIRILNSNPEVVAYAKKLKLQQCIVNGFEEEKWLNQMFDTDYRETMRIVKRERAVAAARLTKAMQREQWTVERVKTGISRRVPQSYKKAVKKIYRKISGK